MGTIEQDPTMSPTAAPVPPDAPVNFKWEFVDRNDVTVSWMPASTGGTPTSFTVNHRYKNPLSPWTALPVLNGSTSASFSIGCQKRMQVHIVASNEHGSTAKLWNDPSGWKTKTLK